jgi:hypothetical protein
MLCSDVTQIVSHEKVGRIDHVTIGTREIAALSGIDPKLPSGYPILMFTQNHYKPNAWQLYHLHNDHCSIRSAALPNDRAV